MQKTIDVLTFGDICVDLILTGKNIVPEFGQTEKLIDEYSFEMGGSCCIFASQTAKLGLKTVVIGKVGRDQFGDFVIKTLNDAGVSTEYIKPVEDEKTGISVALSKGHDRAILTYNGTIDGVGMDDIDDDLLRQVRHLHIGSYFLMKKLQPHYLEIVKRMKKYGSTISIDTNWDPEEKWDSGLWDILPYVDIIMLNENEIMAIANCDNLDKAVEKIRKVVSVVVVKKGEKGGQVFYREGSYTMSALPGKVIDTVGAGDSFDGGFVYGFLTGKSLDKCLDIGCICGSLNVRSHGGTNGQPRLNELKDIQL